MHLTHVLFVCQCSATVLRFSKLLFVAIYWFYILVLICSCSHCGMGVCCSVSGVCMQACRAAQELPEWTVVTFCIWSLIQRTKFFKGIEVLMSMWSEKPLSNVLCSVYVWAVCTPMLSIDALYIVLWFLCCVLFHAYSWPMCTCRQVFVDGAELDPVTCKHPVPFWV